MSIAGYRVLNVHVEEPILRRVHEEKRARRLTLDEYVTEALTEKMARDVPESAHGICVPDSAQQPDAAALSVVEGTDSATKPKE